MTDANELLMGSGAKSCKFDNLGDTWVGTIADTPTAKQMTKYQSTELDYWPSGDPKMQIVVPLQTEVRDPGDPSDDGRRVLFVPPRMMGPVKEAILRAGAKGLQVGGRLAVRWASGSGQGEGNPKLYAAEYAPPQVEMPITGGQQPASTPPAPPAPAAPAQPAAGGMLTPAAPTTATPATPAAGGMLANAVPTNQAPPPPGVDPAVWAGLPDAQRQAILAAMAPAADPFTPAAPF